MSEAFVLAPLRRSRADPVVRPPARIVLLDRPSRGTRDGRAASSGFRSPSPRGTFTFSKRLRRAALRRAGALATSRATAPALSKPPLALAGLGHRHGRHAEEGSFHGGRHGAGVRHVVAEVRAVIDPRDDEHGPLRQEAEHAEVHAVRRCSVHREPPLPHLIDAQRSMQGQRVPDRALLTIGRHDVDVAQRLERRRQRVQSRARESRRRW